MPKGGDRSSKRARGQARAVEAEILRLYLTGRTFYEIGEQLSMSRRGVSAAYSRALRLGVAQPEATQLRREAQGRLEILRRKLFEDFETSKEISQRCEISDRIVRIEQRLSALLGLDVPLRFAVGLYPDNTGNDDATVAELRENLSTDELRQLWALANKAHGNGAIETTAQPADARAPAPDFEGEQTKAMPKFDPPPPPAIGETPSEREVRWTRYDVEIANLETMLALADTEADKVKFSIQLADLRRRRDGK